MLTPGTTLGPYEILSSLGVGGMGEVYRARDSRLDRDVAVKVLPEDMARDKERVLRFEREAKLLATLNHPHIAAIHGFEESNGKKFLVLEFVEGETLSQRIKRGPLPIEDALDIG
jgi:serine/threonine protein kinase